MRGSPRVHAAQRVKFKGRKEQQDFFAVGSVIIFYQLRGHMNDKKRRLWICVRRIRKIEIIVSDLR
jgi:hypothetical protein